MYLLTLVSPMSMPSEQLTVDPGRTPSGVFAAHPADQVADFAGNDRPSRLSAAHLPGPEQAKTGTMPGYDRLGLNDGSAQRQSRQSRDSRTHKKRSTGVNLGRFLAERCSTPIWWCRAKFSSSRGRERKIERKVARTDVREMSIGRKIERSINRAHRHFEVFDRDSCLSLALNGFCSFTQNLQIT